MINNINAPSNSKHNNSTPIPLEHSKRTKRNKIPRLSAAEKMAKFWEEGSSKNLMDLCEKLGQECRIHETAVKAGSFMSDKQQKNMMDWLGQKMMCQAYPQIDGSYTYTDIFAIPLKGKNKDIKSLVEGPSFSEQMVALIRGSSMASYKAGFMFVTLPLPIISVSNFTLDTIGMIRSALELGSQGNTNINMVQSNLKKIISYFNDVKTDTAVVIGLRIISLLAKQVPEDIFQYGADAGNDKMYETWGTLAGEVGIKHNVFIGMPQKLPAALVFLGTEDVLDAFKTEEKSYGIYPVVDNADTHEIHVCETDEYMWFSKVWSMGRIIGPVQVNKEVFMMDHEAFIENLCEDSEDVIAHEELSDLPGISSPSTVLLN